MLILGIIIIIVSLYLLYLKYRVVFTGEKCKGKIIGIVDQNAGYVVGGISVKKHAYIIKLRIKSIIRHTVVSFYHWEKEKLEKKYLYLKMKSMEKKFLSVLIFV